MTTRQPTGAEPMATSEVAAGETEYRAIELQPKPKCPRCRLHFSGDHLCAADHDGDCDIRTSRDGWDASCSCSRGRP